MDPTGLTAFTIYDADAALYEDAAEVFLGWTAERATLGGSYTPQESEPQGGEPKTLHVRELYELELAAPLATQLPAGAAARIGSVGRAFNRQFTFVIVWWDARRGAWIKRCYFGVTAQPARVEAHAGGGGGRHSSVPPEVVFQTLNFRAQRMNETCGYGAKPSLTVVYTGEVRYVSATERLVLWNYLDGIFTPVNSALLTGRAAITPASDHVDLTIGGALAAQATTAAGLLTHALHDGQTFSDAVPRLEFWMEGARLASLAQDGTLNGTAMVESATQPAGPLFFHFATTGTPVWLFSIGNPVTAPAFGDLP